MKSFLRAVVLAAAALPTLAPAQDVAAPSGAYVLDKTHANLLFQVVHMGLSPYTARFDRFDAALTLNVEDPSKSAITASVDVGSVSTNYAGEKNFNEEIAFDSKILNGKEFPKIEFVSKSITQTSATTATITGDLTMLGVTKEIELNAELTGSVASHPFAGKPAVGFVASGEIDRTAWGMSYLASPIPQIAPAAIVAPQVKVMIQAEFVKAD